MSALLHSASPMAAAMSVASGALAALTPTPAQDPLRLDLPPVMQPEALPAETVRALGAMYLQAELEQVGIVHAADLLADAQYQLPLQNSAVMKAIGDYARAKKDWLNREERLRLFGRLFGLGTGTGPDAGSGVNHDFQRRMAAFAQTVLQVAEPWRGASPPRTAPPQALWQTGVDLLGNLGPRQYGNALPAGRQIQTQLQAAIGILSHEGVTSYLGVRTMWEVLRALFKDQLPDAGRFVSRGQSGMRLLHWIAQFLPWFLDPDSPNQPDPQRAAPWAAQWLEASGFRRSG